jgi:hypothetical protein
MPFDAIPQHKLTLADLAWRLRHPETWPPNFRWRYWDCNSCAMGLAWSLSHDGKPAELVTHMATERAMTRAVKALLADAAAMNSRQFAAIFRELRGRPGFGGVVTPADVADAIDRYLVRRESRMAKEAINAV